MRSECAYCDLLLNREMFVADRLLTAENQQDIHYKQGFLEGIQWIRDIHLLSDDCRRYVK